MMREFLKNFKNFTIGFSLIVVLMVMFIALGAIIPAIAFETFGPVIGLAVGILCYAFLAAAIKAWDG